MMRPRFHRNVVGQRKNATKRASEELQSNRDHQNRLRSSLDLRGEQGLQSTYDMAMSELTYLLREHERQEATRRRRGYCEKRSRSTATKLTSATLNPLGIA